jgi:hypothetical protein
MQARGVAKVNQEVVAEAEFMFAFITPNEPLGSSRE